MDKKQIVSLVVVAIVFAAGGFFGGMKYQQHKATSSLAARAGQFAGRAAGQGGAAGGAGRGFSRGAGTFLTGQVLSVSNNSVTIKSMSGGSQVAILAPSTQYNKSVNGAASDVTTGENVVVTGSQNSDGSITAQSVQIRPASSTPPSIVPINQ
jgi:hypothetical protein